MSWCTHLLKLNIWIYVLYNSVRHVICEGCHFTHVQKVRAWPHHFTKRLREDVWAHTTSLTPSRFIEMPVPNQESELSCLCVLGGVDISIGLWKHYGSEVFFIQVYSCLIEYVMYVNLQSFIILSITCRTRIRGFLGQLKVNIWSVHGSCQIVREFGLGPWPVK